MKKLLIVSTAIIVALASMTISTLVFAVSMTSTIDSLAQIDSTSYSRDGEANKEISGPLSQDDKKKLDDTTPRSTYDVLPGKKLEFVSGRESDQDKKIWNSFKKFMPDDMSDKYVEQYRIFNDEESDYSAYVSDDDSDGKWSVNVNIAIYKESSDREKAAIFIHEIAHIASLNISQLDINVGESSCLYFFVGEGCAKQNSSINQFSDEFWSQDDINKVGGPYGEDGSELYEDKPDDYVSEYAASNPIEDFAETFAQFVMIFSKPSGKYVAGQKILFMYDQSNLVDLRNYMRPVLKQFLTKDFGG